MFTTMMHRIHATASHGGSGAAVATVFAFLLIGCASCSRAENRGGAHPSAKVAGAPKVVPPTEVKLGSGGAILDLGTLGGDGSRLRDVNSSGQGVGTSQDAKGVDRAFYWSGAMARMDDIGSAYSAGIAINEKGQAILYGSTDLGDASPWRVSSQGNIRGFALSRGKTTELDAGRGYTMPLSINNRSEIAGVALFGGEWDQAFLWRDGKLADLGPPKSYGPCGRAVVNDNGVIVGDDIHGLFRWAKGGFDQIPSPLGAAGSRVERVNSAGVAAATAYMEDRSDRAVLLDGLKLRLLVPGSSDSIASAINEAGVVAGAFRTSSGAIHAYRWQTGKLTDLGSVPGFPNSAASYMNERGTIAGYLSAKPAKNAYDVFGHPFVVARKRMVDLATMVPPSTGWKLERVIGVDDRGRIFGNGLHNAKKRAFMIVPPAGFWGTGGAH